jgi:hypothetical protein
MTPLQQLSDRYDPGGDVNLAGFSGSLTTYAISLAALVAASRATGGAPTRYSLGDLVVGGLATHKFSRLLAKGSVTSPLRAPFTQFEEAAGNSEHHEVPRGEHGVRHTVGELLTCPFCRAARGWAAVFAVTGISDFLQPAYARLSNG